MVMFRLCLNIGLAKASKKPAAIILLAVKRSLKNIFNLQLQTKDNFLLITGFGSPVISGKKLRKTDASYIALAKVINEKHNEELDYNGAKSKYDWLLKAKDLPKSWKRL